MVIAANGFAGENAGQEAHSPRDGFPAELITVSWKNEVLAKPEAGEREKLPLQEIKKDGGDVRGFPMLIHGADFAGEKEFEARGQRIHIGRRQNRHAAGREQAGNIAEKPDGAFHVLDNLDGGDQSELLRAQERREIGLVKIDGDMGKPGRETIFREIRSENVATHRRQSRGHGAGTRTQVGSLQPRTDKPGEDFISDEIMKTAVGRCRNHHAVPPGTRPL